MTEKVKERRPALAVFLSLVIPGLGQVYNGQLRRALVLYAIFVLGTIVAFSALFISYHSFLIYFFGLFIVLGLRIFAVIDAFTGARRIGELELRRFNRWYVYVTVVLVTEVIFGFIDPSAYYQIPSGAMKPTLVVGDRLVAKKVLFQSDEPERGDVIVFKKPSDNETDYIKRLIGLPGDRIQVIKGILQINGKPVGREKVGESTDDDTFGTRSFMVYRETLPNGRQYLIWESSDNEPLDNTPEYQVPEGHYFFIGDNRDNSRDSRFLSDVGYVPAENFVSRAEFLLFSLSDSASLWQIWRWPQTMRFDRAGKVID